MSKGAHTRFAFLLALTLLMACGDALPCRTCPPIDGTYSVHWADAGADSTCAASAPRVPTWTMSAIDSQVSATIADVTLSGTLYDSYDLLLSGSAADRSYRLKALAIPQGTGADAGITLQGTFTTRALKSSGSCELKEEFTAQRISR